MDIRSRHALLSLCIAPSLLLSACGGGGMTRSEPAPAAQPPPPPPPPPPAAAQTGPCQAPVTGPCNVTTPGVLAWNEFGMTGGRQSDFELNVTGGGWLNLRGGEYRFGRTSISGASLVVWDTLISDVFVLHDASYQGKTSLWLTGTVRGNVTNDDLLSLRHKCGTGLNACIEDRHSRIEGNYTQGATAELEAVLGWDLQITGSAALDGKLTLVRGTSQSYVMPTAPASVLILHANGGIAGQFASWGSDGLFVEGTVRYASNDVFFDATRISVQAAMASAGQDRETLAVASRLDRSFGRADGFAAGPASALSETQRQFVASAASIQHIGDVEQARRSLDSLSGRAHALAAAALDDQFASSTARLRTRLDALAPGAATPRIWSETFADSGRLSGAHATDGVASGYEAWLSSNWLVGGSVASSESSMHFDRYGGEVAGQTPMANAYAYYRDTHWYATGVAGVASTSLQTRRPIDLGIAGLHDAQSRRRVGELQIHGEVGGRVNVGRGRLSPFVGLDYAYRRDDGFTEQGDTGFELAAAPASTGLLSGSLGLRFAQDWRFEGNRWLRLDLDARYQRRVADYGDDPQAAFVGTPDVAFELAAWQPLGSSAMTLGFTGGLDRYWQWSLDYERQFGTNIDDSGWLLGVRREF